MYQSFVAAYHNFWSSMIYPPKADNIPVLKALSLHILPVAKKKNSQVDVAAGDAKIAHYHPGGELLPDLTNLIFSIVDLITCNQKQNDGKAAGTHL